MQEEIRNLEYVISEYEKLIEENKFKQNMTRKNYSHDVDTMINMLTRLEYKEQTLKTNIEKPYFARIDFKSNDSNDKDVCYIGKIGTINEDNKIITVDWRTPIASLYYDNAIGKCYYIAPEGKIDGELLIKRQYDIEKRKLNSFHDVDVVSSDELLNSSLNESMDSRLKNIVATIQKEQNEIIRKPIEENIIVQGVAGSGKTTVALHRIAYLVYQNRDHIDISQYMIIGPNKFFVNYISSVLPDLDVNGVSEFDLLDFTNVYLGENIKLDKSEDNNITKYKMGMEYKELLDKYVDELKDLVIPDKDLEMYGFSIIDKKEIEKIYKRVEKETNFIFDKVERTIMFLQELINSKKDILLVKANDYIDTLFKGEKDLKKLVDISNKRDKIRDEIKNNCSHILKKYFNIVNEKTSSLYLKFLKSVKDSSNKIKYEDLVALMYLRYNIVGNYDYIKYQHIVIDEAQDYGPFLFYTLKKIFKNATFSIFGDLAQTIYEYRTIETWDNVKNIFLDTNVYYLKKSYRTTIEIMNKANLINKHLGLTIADAVIRHGADVKIEKSKNLLDKINICINKNYKTIAIISKNKEDSLKVYNELKDKIDINLITDDSLDYTGGIVSITSSLSKGLEFDAVIINKADSSIFDINNSFDMKLLYVSMTRALHELVITYENNLVKTLYD